MHKMQEACTHGRHLQHWKLNKWQTRRPIKPKVFYINISCSPGTTGKGHNVIISGESKERKRVFMTAWCPACFFWAWRLATLSEHNMMAVIQMQHKSWTLVSQERTWKTRASLSGDLWVEHLYSNKKINRFNVRAVNYVFLYKQIIWC